MSEPVSTRILAGADFARGAETVSHGTKPNTPAGVLQIGHPDRDVPAVNLEASQRAGVTIRSELLRLASSVTQGG